MEKEKILEALETLRKACQEQEKCITCSLRDEDGVCMIDEIRSSSLEQIKIRKEKENVFI